ncbi:hypothetical protein [Streptomyces sp. NRRL S-1448]|uniref:hypothetical protein n=1 Tax=Streptomyces sp. NRRL S-1448 TaxID=1463883 RepID=UPI0004C141FC|nr:hypothetical protein [Streptomyces sp. NRRL S-1448]
MSTNGDDDGVYSAQHGGNTPRLLLKKREHLVGGKLPYDSTVFYSNYGTKVPDETPAAGDSVDFDKVGKP